MQGTPACTVLSLPCHVSWDHESQALLPGGFLLWCPLRSLPLTALLWGWVLQDLLQCTVSGPATAWAMAMLTYLPKPAGISGSGSSFFLDKHIEGFCSPANVGNPHFLLECSLPKIKEIHFPHLIALLRAGYYSPSICFREEHTPFYHCKLAASLGLCISPRTL